jgi:hypothetical protein
MNKSSSIYIRFKHPDLIIAVLTMTLLSLIIAWYIELLTKEIFLLG